MPSNAKRKYFQKVVVDYICGDIDTLLCLKLKQAGPLLATVVNGIGAMAGMLFGFSKERGEEQGRWIEFFEQHMELGEELAQLVYIAVRCGVAHEGVPKPGLVFFVEYDRPNQKEIVYRDTEGYFWLDVVQLAKCFVEAVKSIRQDTSVLRKLPPRDPKAEEAFQSVDALGVSDIEEFCRVVSRFREDKGDERISRGEMKERSSSSAVLPEHLATLGMSAEDCGYED